MLALLLGGQATFTAAAQSTPEATPIGGGTEAAIEWLVSQQDASGGFIGYSGEPDAGVTIDAVIAIASVPGAYTDVLEAAAGFLEETGADYAVIGPGQAGKLVLALVALGEDPAAFGDGSLVEGIANSIPPAETLEEGQIGYCGFGPFDHAICTLALVAADAEIPAGFVDALIASQIENSGWAWDGSADNAAADSNTSALAIQALIAAGVDASDSSIQNALAYLTTVIDPEQGGFAYDANFGLVADANSTATVIQALIAAGEDPASDQWGRSFDALAGFQNESGAFRYQHEFPYDNLFATVHAVPALAGLALPIVPS